MHKDGLISKIAGDIVTDDEPGKTMRAWRIRLEVKQSELAKFMGVKPSVLCDYEIGRRSSPGVKFVKRYVEGLVKLTKKSLKDMVIDGEGLEGILEIREFEEPVIIEELVKAVKGKVVEGDEMLDDKIYGYTVLDSIKAIYALSGFEFYRIFGSTSERALVFTKVGMGRSPLVAVRVSPLKPRVVVLHRPRQLDPLAIELARKERIVLVVSEAEDEEEIKEGLKGFS
ncbi:MAG: transcriptional regulator [Thaumarchaeota archaeon]|nr:transcriptional regulator [Nitrososphaerota archaeon]